MAIADSAVPDPFDRWMSGRTRAIKTLMRGVELEPADVVLDVAGGDASLTRLVTSSAGGRGVSHDRSRRECQAARFQGTAAVRGDVRQLPFRDGCARLTLAFEIIEHMEEWELPGFVDELWRVTCPGGLVALSTPNRYSLQSMRGVARYFRDGTVWNGEDQTHVQLLSARALRRAIGRRFQVKRTLGYYLAPELRGRPSRLTHIVSGSGVVVPFCHKLLILAERTS
ncbi:MAG: class I SAM-dependent methyltransferase [Dehalococcoidia bacterium]